METKQLLVVIEKGFAELRTELDEKFGKIDGKFDKIDGKFDKIDGKFDKIDEKFVNMDLRLNEVGADVRHAHVMIENLRSDLRMFDEGDPSPLATRVSALEVRVTDLERKRRK